MRLKLDVKFIFIILFTWSIYYQYILAYYDLVVTFWIQKVLPIPESLTVISIVQHPLKADGFLAATSTNSILEIDIGGLCNTLVATPSTSTGDYTSSASSANAVQVSVTLEHYACSTLRHTNISSSIRIIQLFQYSFSNKTNKMLLILAHKGLWNMDIRTYTITLIVSFKDAITPKYIVPVCSVENIVDIGYVAEGNDGQNMAAIVRVNVLTGEATYKNSLNSFMSGYRVPVANYDCSRYMEVAVSSALSDIYNYTWFKQTVVHRGDNGQLTLYRKFYQPIEIYWSSSETYQDPVNILSSTSDGEEIVAVSNQWSSILILNTNLWINKSNVRFYRRVGYSCGAKCLDVIKLESLEGCAYRCAKRKDCRAFMYHGMNTCSIFYCLYFIKTENDVCYVVL